MGSGIFAGDGGNISQPSPAKILAPYLSPAWEILGEAIMLLAPPYKGWRSALWLPGVATDCQNRGPLGCLQFECVLFHCPHALTPNFLSLQKNLAQAKNKYYTGMFYFEHVILFQGSYHKLYTECVGDTVRKIKIGERKSVTNFWFSQKKLNANGVPQGSNRDTKICNILKKVSS